MKIDPLVSVIMNCYNGDKYLHEAIDSVYAQTYKNWEIVFWDNSSIDKSSKIAKTYDSKLKYFKSHEKTLLGQARVEAVKMAKGDYLAFLDVDDVWLDNKLEKQIRLFAEKQTEVGIVYGRTEVIFEDSIKDNYVLKEGNLLPEGNIFSELAKECFIVFSSSMVDKKKFHLVGGFPSNFSYATDYWIFLHLSRKYECFALQEVCCKYRVHSSNLSNEKRTTAVKESIDILENMQPNSEIILGLKHQYVSLLIESFKEKKYLDVFNILIKKKVLLKLIERILKKLS